ncbi:protein kinase C delta type-like [Leptodactylus fuscus]
MAATGLYKWISAILRKLPFIGHRGRDWKRGGEKKEDGKRKREEDGESGLMEKKMRGDEKKEDGKRKREEDGDSGLMEKKKKTGREASILEDDKSRAGSSQDPGTSSPYPKLYITRFTIHQELGRGSFGQVVLASVTGRNTFVAVKIITKTWENAAILRSPFLCHLYAAHQSEDRAYFIMEHLSGGSLEELLRRSNPLKIDTVRFYTAEIVCGLQFLHGHNIVHRDIKPDNIMLHGNGHIQIIDMGLARNIVTSSKKICGMAGTCHYMAPEMLLRQDYDAAVDWWSLGIVISRMSSGYSPFYFGHNWEVAKLSIIKDEPRISTCLNDQLQHLLKDLLQKNPEKRLGVNSNIRGHPFFNTICWEDLELRRVQPPFIPSEAVLEKQHLSWPEHQFLHPVAKFNFMSPSWTRTCPCPEPCAS